MTLRRRNEKRSALLMLFRVKAGLVAARGRGGVVVRTASKRVVVDTVVTARFVSASVAKGTGWLVSIVFTIVAKVISSARQSAVAK